MAKRTHRRRPLEVLFEDERWLAVLKPQGVPVHGGAGSVGPSILERLQAEQGKGLYLVHRLDLPTGGVLLLAKDKTRASQASSAWEEVTKTYGALCFGTPRKGWIEAKLRAPDGRLQSAKTRVTEVNPSPDGAFSLCQVMLGTGRFHQIRRHLAGIDCPIVGDDKYGRFEQNKQLNFALAEAKQAKIKHPMLTCMRLSFPPSFHLPELSAPTPPRWSVVLQHLGWPQERLSELLP